MAKKDSNVPSSDAFQDTDYVDAAFVAKVHGSKPVSSSLLDKIFIPSRTLPSEFVSQYIDDPSKLEKTFLSEIPLFTTPIENPWWGKSASPRDYDKIICDIYGSLCLADDRHLVDMIVSAGAPLRHASKYTLKKVVEGALSMKAEHQSCLPDQSWLNKPLKNTGRYYHIEMKDIFDALSIRNTKQNRQTILTRLKRLSIMHLVLGFEKDGVRIPNRTVTMNIVDKDFFPLLDVSKVRNKNSITSETFTDLLVNIDTRYVDSLEKDGYIDRKRFINHYPALVGKNGVVDFFKFIDKQKRTYINGMKLNDLIAAYYEHKMSMFGMNKSKKTIDLRKTVVEMKEVFLEKYNIQLRALPNDKNEVTDYELLYEGKER